MHEYYSIRPELEDYWRAIILFGRNVASYKFSLAKSLLQLATMNKCTIRLEDLAIPFSENIVEHLEFSEKQCTSRSSKFIKSCIDFKNGEVSKDELVDVTKKFGFNNVIDAFHVVHGKYVPVRFFADERKDSKSIKLTDDFFKLATKDEVQKNLLPEAESRWRLVESAWALSLPTKVIAIEYDGISEELFTPGNRRVGLTSCRGALNGYQKGYCFYCFKEISIDEAAADYFADVDHFFPHKLGSYDFGNIDGVWNLVLSCKECNRGAGGKFDLIPTLPLLKRLSKRNEYLISSHHPLRETIIRQTGSTASRRAEFLQSAYAQALRMIIHTWKPKDTYEERF